MRKLTKLVVLILWSGFASMGILACEGDDAARGSSQDDVLGDAAGDVAREDGGVQDGASDSPADGEADTSESDTSQDAPSDEGVDGAGDVPDDEVTQEGVCPSLLPQEGSACPREGLVCEFGADPRVACKEIASCTSTGWSVVDPMCMDPPADRCPDTIEMASGEACENVGAFCIYDEIACECSDCIDGPVQMCGLDPPQWMCQFPDPDLECPRARPNLGTDCPVESKFCQYRCGEQGATLCEGGVWVVADGGECPVSTRLVKDHIHYLSPEEIALRAEQALAIPLTTFEYTDPVLGDRTHLGFIIEDLPRDSPAIQDSGFMVDLYGYASLLLAATQTQQQEIDALRSELALLRQEIEALKGADDPRKAEDLSQQAAGLD